MQQYLLEFRGYFQNEHSIPDIPGIYCVYLAKLNKKTNSISPKKILYIGESININERISNHAKLSLWKHSVDPGDVLCFSISTSSWQDRERIQKALVCCIKPKYNDNSNDEFEYGNTIVKISGKSDLMNKRYSINKT